MQMVLLAVMAMSLALAPAPAGAAAIRSLPGFDVNVLPANDDGSTGSVPIGFTVDFFGSSYTTLFVNNNGNVTFDAALSTFTPFDLTSTARVIIAAFFGDVDTRNAGSAVVTYGNDTVDGRPAFGVDWDGVGVGYYSSHIDKLNKFQLILIDRSDIAPGDFDIEFNYDQIQWETGDASGGSGGLGGSSARVGYSNGTGAPATFFELPGSAVNGALLDTNAVSGLIYNSLNSAVDGRYLFNVRGGVVQFETVCDDDLDDDGDGPIDCEDSDCALDPVCISTCGNGMVEGPEECDDGNLDNGDCCSSFCTYEPAESPCQADADYCTIDRCDGAGTCAFVAPVECTALDQCHVPGTCDPGTGVCSNPNKPNGFACDDGDFCTAPDVCTDGVCLGNTVGADSDQDGYCDSWENLVGCNPNDFAETPPQGASSPGSAGPVPGQVLLVFAVPSSRRVSVASEPACATAGVCGATGLCVAGKVGDPCDAAADCNGSPGVCRVIVNYADVPGLGLSAALLNRKPLAGFSPATAGCARKVDVTLDPSKEFNRVRLKAMGTVHGRSRFDRDRITFAP